MYDDGMKGKTVVIDIKQAASERVEDKFIVQGCL